MNNNHMLVKSDVMHHEQMQLVSFGLDNEEYGVDVLCIREIIRLPSITKMPNSPHYVDGIINLRGTVIPIISLRRKFGLMDSDFDKTSRILVMEVGGGLTGFVVDSVAEVIRISTSEIQPSPPVVGNGEANECIAGVVNQGDRLLVLLELKHLFSDEDQSTISSMSI